MNRRAALLLIPLALAACSKEKAPPPPVRSDLPPLVRLAEKAKPGTLAVMIADLGTGMTRGINADEPMPMQSVFKLPLAIVVLDAVDKGKLSLDDKITLTKDRLSPAWSPIAKAFPKRKIYTIAELLHAAVAESDNTAADVLMRLIGGPEAVTGFFDDRGIENFRVDRYEAELQPQAVGLPPSTGQWIGSDAFEAAQAKVPVESQKAAMRLYLADPRDRVSPRGMVRILTMLADGKLLSPASTATLMGILKNTSTGADRLKAGIPDGAVLYHKTGSGPNVGQVNSATNDVGIMEMPGGRRIAVAAFLSGSELPAPERAAIIADVARIATRTPRRQARGRSR